MVGDAKVALKLFYTLLEELIFSFDFLAGFVCLFKLIRYFLQLLLVFESELLVRTHIGGVGLDCPSQSRAVLL